MRHVSVSWNVWDPLSVRSVFNATQESRRDFDDREVFNAVEAQRLFDEHALSGPDSVFTDFRLIESDLAGFPPGKQVEEATEPAAVCDL